MIRKVKHTVKSALRLIGYDVYLHPLSPKVNDYFQLYKALDYFGIDTVFDIGANTGQFASELRSIGYKGRIISFEPLSNAYEKLKKATSRDPLWVVHSRGALGDFSGSVEINISKDSQSSSLLPMFNTLKDAAPGAVYIGKEKVHVETLDSIAPKYLVEGERFFLKIDAQGFEMNVLEGAKSTLHNCQGILCELSLVPLYENQILWLEVIDFFKKSGFTIWSVQKGFVDKKNGRALQLDAIFFRY